MAARKRRKSKLDPYLDQVGVLADRQLAELAGVTPENVRAFRKRRGIPARWRGEGEPTTARSEPTTPPGEPAPPVPSREPVRVVQGFQVTVEIDGEEQNFVVVGADIAKAAFQAIDSLEAKGIDGRVRGIRYLADALMA